MFDEQTQSPQPKILRVYISWYINEYGRPWTSLDVNPRIRPVHGQIAGTGGVMLPTTEQMATSHVPRPISMHVVVPAAFCPDASHQGATLTMRPVTLPSRPSVAVEALIPMDPLTPQSADRTSRAADPTSWRDLLVGALVAGPLRVVCRGRPDGGAHPETRSARGGTTTGAGRPSAGAPGESIGTYGTTGCLCTAATARTPRRLSSRSECAPTVTAAGLT